MNLSTGKVVGQLLMCTILWMSANDLFAQSTAQPKKKTISLFQAIRSGRVDELEKELEKGASVNDTLNSYSALMAATLSGSLEQMKILIDHGANVNYQSSDSVTALWLAVPDWDKTKLLLDHGADVNHKIQGYGILVKLAAIPGAMKLFHLLIDHGADLKNMASDNYLLYNAAGSGDTATIGFLIRNGFNVNDTVSFGDYPINNAEANRSFNALKMIVDNGANVNVRVWVPFGLDAFKGFTPLMFAAICNDKPSILYLLDHGADPNARNKYGYTPLMLFQQSEANDPETTLAFIKHGAIVSAEASDGTDALYYAMKKGNTATVELLEKYAKQ